MSLLKTIDELKQYVSLDARDIPPGIAQGLREAEQVRLLPILGPDLAQWLQTQYEAPGFDHAADTLANELLCLVQRPLARLGTALGIPEHQVSIDATGIHFIASDTSKTAFPWQVEQLRAKLEQRGLRDLDTLVQWLEDNYESSVELQAWAVSEAGQRHRRELFTSTAEFQEYENISDSRAVFALLGPVRRRLEAFELGRVLGADFLQELRDQVRTRALTSENRNLLRTYVLPALASLTIGHGIGEVGLKLTGDGLDASKPENTTREYSPDLDHLLQHKASDALMAGDRWLRQLTSYLDRTASATRFATYFHSPTYTAPAPPASRDYTAKTYRFC